MDRNDALLRFEILFAVVTRFFLPAMHGEFLRLHPRRLGHNADDDVLALAAAINRFQLARDCDVHGQGVDALRKMFGQRNSGGLEEAQAIAGFERGRGDGPAQLRVQRVGGWAGKQAAFGEVKRRPACERAVDLRRRQTVRGDEDDFVIGVTVLGRAQLQAQWLGPARQRLIVRGHDAIRRQRHAKEAIERRSRGGICIFERPPTFVLPGFENRAPQRQRFREQIERPALKLPGKSFGMRLFEFGKCRARLGAPLQSRLVGMQHQTQFQCAGIGNGLWLGEIAKPIFPMRDLLLAFPCGHFGFDQAQVRDAVHEFGIANMAPAQFPRDVKPAIKNVARTLGPQFEFLPIAVSRPRSLSTGGRTEVVV